MNNTRISLGKMGQILQTVLKLELNKFHGGCGVFRWIVSTTALLDLFAITATKKAVNVRLSLQGHQSLL